MEEMRCVYNRPVLEFIRHRRLVINRRAGMLPWSFDLINQVAAALSCQNSQGPTRIQRLVINRRAGRFPDNGDKNKLTAAPV